MKMFRVRQWLKMALPLECMLFLSGCNKVVNWGKSNFAQTKRYSEDFTKASQAFIRSTFVYSQFTMAATFDAIFLTDQMRMLFVDYHKRFHGLNSEQEATLRQRLLNENKYFISFYVIGFQKEHLYDSGKALFTGVYQKFSDFLGTKDSSWNISMLVGDKKYYPESVRAVDLPMEYRSCFGIKLNQFNTTYLVRFAVQDPASKPIFEPFKKYNVKLCITSPLFESDAMEWHNIVYTKGDVL